MIRIGNLIIDKILIKWIYITINHEKNNLKVIVEADHDFLYTVFAGTEDQCIRFIDETSKELLKKELYS